MRGDFLILTKYSGKRCVIALDHIVHIGSTCMPVAYGSAEVTLIETTGGMVEVKDTVESIIELIEKRT